MNLIIFSYNFDAYFIKITHIYSAALLTSKETKEKTQQILPTTMLNIHHNNNFVADRTIKENYYQILDNSVQDTREISKTHYTFST